MGSNGRKVQDAMKRTDQSYMILIDGRPFGRAQWEVAQELVSKMGPNATCMPFWKFKQLQGKTGRFDR